MINVYFMRKDAGQPRGGIADIPTNAPCPYVDPFIIVQSDETKFPEGILTDDTVRLDLDKLMAQYPDTTEEYTDEDGNVKSRTVYGYFSEYGQSVVQDSPIITLSDILRG